MSEIPKTPYEKIIYVELRLSFRSPIRKIFAKVIVGTFKRESEKFNKNSYSDVDYNNSTTTPTRVGNQLSHRF